MDAAQKSRIAVLSAGLVLGILGCLVVGLLLERTLARTPERTGERPEVTAIRGEPAELTSPGPSAPSAR